MAKNKLATVEITEVEQSGSPTRRFQDQETSRVSLWVHPLSVLPKVVPASTHSTKASSSIPTEKHSEVTMKQIMVKILRRGLTQLEAKRT